MGIYLLRKKFLNFANAFLSILNKSLTYLSVVFARNISSSSEIDRDCITNKDKWIELENALAETYRLLNSQSCGLEVIGERQLNRDFSFFTLLFIVLTVIEEFCYELERPLLFCIYNKLFYWHEIQIFSCRTVKLFFTIFSAVIILKHLNWPLTLFFCLNYLEIQYFVFKCCIFIITVLD